ncbi:RNA polymerase sigma factor [Bacteroides sp. 51]|uniref:RNA polymerase sigma factor n=1 Tax=Bacteroides sp. 51 TaxID=2302938 RepID=UPI0013D67EFA|nr:RNA polymerase sigma factor [Bacteroides sp. 51]NDV80503.1 RNA polymerase sigma factor [Bacteroides sp. 51]
MSLVNTKKDSELWTSFVNGDKDSFSLFYKYNYAKLYAYGIGLGMDDETIRDIIQELFIKLYTRPHLIKEVATIQPFLFASVRNAFINHEKFNSRHLSYHQIENFELNYSVENSQIEDEEELQILRNKVNHVIGSLTARQKEIIYLRFLHQMEYHEIAHIMDVSEQAARNLTYRAMEKMRKENPDFMLCFFLLTLFAEWP